MNYGSLFSGIGLLDRGVEMAFHDAGIPLTCAWQVEIDPFCRAVLAKHGPEIVRHEDVRCVGSTGAALAPTDLIVGGFPCTDVSLAGKGEGLSGERSGLWFEYLRIIRELRPRGVLIENVLGLVRRGLDVVVSGLADAGYEVEATRIRASDVGAPHRRERIFIVAYAERSELRQQPGRGRGARRADSSVARDAREGVAYTDGARELQRRGRIDEGGRRTVDGGDAQLSDPGGERREGAERGEQRGGRAPLQRARREGADRAEPCVGRDADGRTRWLDGCRWPAAQGVAAFPWEPPRVQAGVVNRGHRLKALGNAVVSQCAYVAARRLIGRLAAQ